MFDSILTATSALILAACVFLISYKFKRLEDQLAKLSESHFELAKNYLNFKVTQQGKK